MNKTYRELFEWLKTFSEEDLDKTATIFDYSTCEYIPVSKLDRNVDSDVLNVDSDVLDDKHPIIQIFGIGV